MHRPPWSPAHHEGPPPRGRPRLGATRRSHADAWLRGDARGRDGGVHEELTAGVVLGRSAFGGKPENMCSFRALPLLTPSGHLEAITRRAYRPSDLKS